MTFTRWNSAAINAAAPYIDAPPCGCRFPVTAEQTFEDNVFRLHGIDVNRYRIVALKSTNHFRAGFRDIAAQIITADGPGLSTERIDVFPRSRTPGPVWPIDIDATYDPSV